MTRRQGIVDPPRAATIPVLVSAVVVVVVVLLFTTTPFPTVVSFLPLTPSCPTRTFHHQRKHDPIVPRTFRSSASDCETSDGEPAIESSSQQQQQQQQQQTWLGKGLLLSSFTDGLQTNPPASDWLMDALVETLWCEEQETTQALLKESNLASPCNGPDPDLLGQLEDTDSVVEGMQNIHSGNTSNNNNNNKNNNNWKKQLSLLCETKNAREGGSSIDLRVLYIPTAMYALRPGSTSKPGKQRGRNRADGKKRRNEMVRLLEGQLQDFLDNNNNHHGDTTPTTARSKDTLFNVRTVTMDFDDASVKQPEEVTVGNENKNKNESTNTNGSWFPEVRRKMKAYCCCFVRSVVG